MLDLDLKKLGESAAAQIEEVTPEELMAQQQAFMYAAQTIQVSRSRYVGYAMAVAAAVFIAVLAGMTLLPQDAPTNAAPVAVQQSFGHEMSVSHQGEEVIRFDGGTQFTLGEGSSAKVIQSNADKVVIGLEQGAVNCDINGNGHTRWYVRAGGYEVLVTGTKFDVQWQPEAAYLNVTVSEGSVLVNGDNLIIHGIRLAAGEKISVEGEQVAISRTDTQETATLMKSSAASKRMGKSKHRRAKTVTAPEKEQSLSEKINSYPYKELWALANELRHQGRPDDAYSALNALRTRFPGKPYGKQATFLLGRISLDSKNNPAQAKQWFETYLKSSPNGRLAEQSIGRLIHICQKSNHSCAKGYAARYLAKYSNGAFAELAKSVLE